MLKLGTDPEFFLYRRGKLIPAFEALPNKGPIFADGFQAEINPEPGMLLGPLQKRVKQMMAEAIARSGADQISPFSVVDIDAAQMARTPVEWQQLGCKPSINLYGKYPQIPEDGATLLNRFAGNHIHFGRICTPKETTRIIKALDSIVAIWMTGVGAGIESPIRRKYYGLAGEFREQKWGLEYRTLSNLPLLHPALWTLTFKLARDVFQMALYDKLDFWYAKEHEVLWAVNETDVERSRAILKTNKDSFERLAGPLAFQLGMHGFSSWSKVDVAHNWGINV